MRPDLNGINNPNYKHGYFERLNRWIKAVKERDKYECQCCHGIKGSKRKVAAHHRKSKEEFPELIFDVDNGITLCDFCHRSLHHKNKVGYYRGKRLSEKHKEKIGASHVGYRHSESAKQKMSVAKLGRIPWNKGIPRTAEEKRKISESHMGIIPWNKGIRIEKGQL